MRVALCPSCEIKKHSAAKSSDGLCDECAGSQKRAEKKPKNDPPAYLDLKFDDEYILIEHEMDETRARHLPVWAFRRLEMAPVLFEALNDFAAWCARNDWGTVPKKLQKKIEDALSRARKLRD